MVEAFCAGRCRKTTLERPLIGNGDSVIITDERHAGQDFVSVDFIGLKAMHASRVEPREQTSLQKAFNHVFWRVFLYGRLPYKKEEPDKQKKEENST